MICWVQFQFRTLDLWRSWRRIYSIVFTMRSNCFWKWESVSLFLAERWCQITIEIEMTDEPGADAEGQCCVLIRGAKWKLTALMSTVLPQGRLAVTSFPFQPRAGSVLPMLCSLPWRIADCRLLQSWSGSLLLLGSSALSQLAWRESWISMVCYSWMTLFRARHQMFVFFLNTDTLPSLFHYLASVLVPRSFAALLTGWN